MPQPIAEVTYNRGASYTIGKTRFYKNKTKLVSSPDLVQRCQVTAGFTVRLLEQPVVKKKVRKVMRAAESGATKRSKSRSNGKRQSSSGE